MHNSAQLWTLLAMRFQLQKQHIEYILQMLGGSLNPKSTSLWPCSKLACGGVGLRVGWWGRGGCLRLRCKKGVWDHHRVYQPFPPNFQPHLWLLCKKLYLSVINISTILYISSTKHLLLDTQTLKYESKTEDQKWLGECWWFLDKSLGKRLTGKPFRTPSTFKGCGRTY